MSKICQITGKKAQIGNNVSHSKHRTKRSFDVNLNVMVKDLRLANIN
ncbi:MAG TPA: 50S ribosomal protein L28, partial [Candidatus Prevotella stercoripullorum]|nr:50S ribosomal protein L28 [Candidatus Prevotella stercoripullorum]